MLPENLKQMSVPAQVESWDPAALTGGSHEFGETLLWVKPEKIAAVCRFLKEKLGFVRLTGLSCIDRYPLEPRFEVLYLLHSLQLNERIKLKAGLRSEAAEIESVTQVWEGANWYEREVFDLFGVRFLNHPDLKRILMPDEWEGHPLRKDFPVHGHKYSYQNE
jgi:NADH-quinone oxidoreductase subunit C